MQQDQDGGAPPLWLHQATPQLGGSLMKGASADDGHNAHRQCAHLESASSQDSVSAEEGQQGAKSHRASGPTDVGPAKPTANQLQHNPGLIQEYPGGIRTGVEGSMLVKVAQTAGPGLKRPLSEIAAETHLTTAPPGLRHQPNGVFRAHENHAANGGSHPGAGVASAATLTPGSAAGRQFEAAFGLPSQGQAGREQERSGELLALAQHQQPGPMQAPGQASHNLPIPGPVAAASADNFLMSDTTPHARGNNGPVAEILGAHGEETPRACTVPSSLGGCIPSSAGPPSTHGYAAGDRTIPAGSTTPGTSAAADGQGGHFHPHQNSAAPKQQHHHHHHHHPKLPMCAEKFTAMAHEMGVTPTQLLAMLSAHLNGTRDGSGGGANDEAGVRDGKLFKDGFRTSDHGVDTGGPGAPASSLQQQGGSVRRTSGGHTDEDDTSKGLPLKRPKSPTSTQLMAMIQQQQEQIAQLQQQQRQQAAAAGGQGMLNAAVVGQAVIAQLQQQQQQQRSQQQPQQQTANAVLSPTAATASGMPLGGLGAPPTPTGGAAGSVLSLPSSLLHGLNSPAHTGGNVVTSSAAAGGAGAGFSNLTGAGSGGAALAALQPFSVTRQPSHNAGVSGDLARAASPTGGGAAGTAGAGAVQQAPGAPPVLHPQGVAATTAGAAGAPPALGLLSAVNSSANLAALGISTAGHHHSLDPHTAAAVMAAAHHRHSFGSDLATASMFAVPHGSGMLTIAGPHGPASSYLSSAGMEFIHLPHPRPPPKPRKPRDPATISKVQQCAAQIMRMIKKSTMYESDMRNALGNNPDTSKALRLLVQEGKLMRTGQGGRSDPFAYRATELGLQMLQDLIITQSLQANTTASQAPSASAAASGGGTAGGASGGAPPGLAPMPSTAGTGGGAAGVAGAGAGAASGAGAGMLSQAHSLPGSNALGAVPQPPAAASVPSTVAGPNIAHLPPHVQAAANAAAAAAIAQFMQGTSTAGAGGAAGGGTGTAAGTGAAEAGAGAAVQHGNQVPGSSFALPSAGAGSAQQQQQTATAADVTFRQLSPPPLADGAAAGTKAGVQGLQDVRSTTPLGFAAPQQVQQQDTPTSQAHLDPAAKLRAQIAHLEQWQQLQELQQQQQRQQAAAQQAPLGHQQTQSQQPQQQQQMLQINQLLQQHLMSQAQHGHGVPPHLKQETSHAQPTPHA